jgi:hypothetical protein
MMRLAIRPLLRAREMNMITPIPDKSHRHDCPAHGERRISEKKRTAYHVRKFTAIKPTGSDEGDEETKKNEVAVDEKGKFGEGVWGAPNQSLLGVKRGDMVLKSNDQSRDCNVVIEIRWARHKKLSEFTTEITPGEQSV